MEPAAPVIAPRTTLSVLAKLTPTPEDVFTSFLYAALVHLTLGSFLETYHGKFPLLAVIFMIFLCLFLGIDWITRISVRQQLPADEPFSKLDSYLKAMLELVGALCLALAFVTLARVLPPTYPPTPEHRHVEIGALFAFALFALTVGGWNLVILRVMQNLSWRSLAIGSLRGNVCDLPDIDRYTQPAITWREEHYGRLTSHINELNETKRFMKEGPGLWCQIRLYDFIRASMLGALNTSFQTLAFHATIANFFVALMIIFTHFLSQDRPVLSLLPLPFALPPAYLWLPAGLFLTWVLFTLNRRQSGAIILLASAVFFYLMLDALGLVLVLAAEQTLANILSHFVLGSAQGSPGTDAVATEDAIGRGDEILRERALQHPSNT